MQIYRKLPSKLAKLLVPAFEFDQQLQGLKPFPEMPVELEKLQMEQTCQQKIIVS